MSEPLRLSQRVAELFSVSRSEAEQLIRNGWVSVDGHVNELPQHRVTTETVTLDPDARLEAVEPATILLHKPAGYDAIEGPKPASALVTPATRWADDPSGERLLHRHFQRLTALVPLDTDASGLLVLSQDGRVWRRLTEDAGLIELEYVVEVRGNLIADGLALLAQGLSYKGYPIPRCKVSWQNETRLRFAMKGVQNGQLRHMCKQVGLEVMSIRRLRIGKIGLGKGPDGAMPPGAWRYLPVGEKF